MTRGTIYKQTNVNNTESRLKNCNVQGGDILRQDRNYAICKKLEAEFIMRIRHVEKTRSTIVRLILDYFIAHGRASLDQVRLTEP